MSSAKSVVILFGLGALGLNLMAACSSTSSGGFSDDDAGPTASLPEGGSTTYDSGIIIDDSGLTGADVTAPPVADASDDAPVDAPVDASTDAPVDAAPDAPDDTDAGAPGSSCATNNLVGKQTCGLCGFQTRVCAPSDPADPASPLVWQEWGYCQAEVEDGCMPGASDTESCGLCGTRNRVCQNDCTYAVGACKNEPANACSPGTVDYKVGLSCTQGGRSRTCDATCQYGSFGACFVPGEPTLTLPDTVGGKVSGQFTLAQASSIPRLSGTCASDSGDIDNTSTAYQYVVLANDSADTLVVSVWTGKAATAGAGYIDTVIASYATATKPASDSERLACSTGVNDTCSGGGDPTACASSWAGLFGTNAVSVAPNSKVYIYVAAYFGDDDGDYQLTARVDTVN